MNINDFKKALREGEVSFSYMKKDGTLRKAIGTLNEKLTPKTSSSGMYKYKCSNINWDIDENEHTNLPKTMIVEIDAAYVNGIKDKNGNEDTEFEDFLEEAICNELSNKTGFCVLDFSYAKVEPKKLSKSQILYYDLEKKGYRSFNESQLVDWNK